MTSKIESLALAMELAGVKRTLDVYGWCRVFGIWDYVAAVFVTFGGKDYCWSHDKDQLEAALAKRFNASVADCVAALDLLTLEDLTPGHPEPIT